MRKVTSSRHKVFELALTRNLDPFSIYRITFNYRSQGNFTAEAALTHKGQKLISQFSRKFDIESGYNTASFNITTEAFMAPTNKDILIHINATNSSGFAPSGPLTNAISTAQELDKHLIIEGSSINVQKIFDLRLHISQKEYSVLDVKGPITKEDTPIVLHGYYLREDGLGAHMPNLFENVFYDFKNIAFSRQMNRHQLHFSFLNRLNAWSKEEIEQYTKEFKWMRFYYSREGKHINEQLFKGGKFVHVGGFDLNPWDLRKDIKIVRTMKDKFEMETYVYLMWESTGIEKMASVLKEFDNVVVTNHWLKDLIEDKVGHPKVHRVEHIAKHYTVPSTGGGGTFNFGYSGGLWERKGVDKIIRAFNGFKTENHRLKIHSRDFVNIPTLLEKLESVINVDPDYIDFTNKTLPDKEYKEWWGTLNCFVFVSSGEGYSIQPRDALLQGIPVILSKNTAHLDLLDVPGILWVDCDQEESAVFSGQPDANLNVGKQFSVSTADVRDKMKEVIDNYPHWKEEAKKGGLIIKEQVDPNNIKKQWEDILL